MAVIGVNGNTKISHHSAKHPSGGEAGGEKQIGKCKIFEFVRYVLIINLTT